MKKHESLSKKINKLGLEHVVKKNADVEFWK
jgi:hypothetical protein